MSKCFIQNNQVKIHVKFYCILILGYYNCAHTYNGQPSYSSSEAMCNLQTIAIHFSIKIKTNLDEEGVTRVLRSRLSNSHYSGIFHSLASSRLRYCRWITFAFWCQKLLEYGANKIAKNTFSLMFLLIIPFQFCSAINRIEISIWSRQVQKVQRWNKSNRSASANKDKTCAHTRWIYVGMSRWKSQNRSTVRSAGTGIVRMAHGLIGGTVLRPQAHTIKFSVDYLVW